MKGRQNFCRPTMGPSLSTRSLILYLNLWMYEWSTGGHITQRVKVRLKTSTKGSRKNLANCSLPKTSRWTSLLPLVAKKINTTWRHTIQDVPVRVFKGRSTAEFSYPIDEEFFEEGPDGDDGEFGDDDALSQCEAYSRLSDLSSDGMCIKPFKMVPSLTG